MRSNKTGHRWATRLCVVAWMTLPLNAAAEDGAIWVHVSDAQNHPLRDVKLSTGTGPESPATDGTGKTRITLAGKTTAGSWVTLDVTKAPGDLVFLSPWNSRAQVPPFDNNPESYVPVVLVKRGERALLENGKFLQTMTERLLARSAVSKNADDSTHDATQRALGELAHTFGLPASDIDVAIRSWAGRSQDPYEQGIAALYEQRYADATKLLTKSVQARELEATEAASRAADANLFLGRSFYDQGKFSDSVDALNKANKWRPDDHEILNALGMSLSGTGDYDGAATAYLRALQAAGSRPGPLGPAIASINNNLGLLFNSLGKVSEAERYFREAIKRDKRTGRTPNPNVAIHKSNLAMVLTEKWNTFTNERHPHELDNDLREAEKLMVEVDRADKLARKQGWISDESPALAAHINNTASILFAKKDYKGAEEKYRAVLSLDAKSGRSDEDKATTLGNLAGLLARQSKYEEAGQTFREAIELNRKALGPDHPKNARFECAYGAMLESTKDLDGAEGHFKEALRIDTLHANLLYKSRDLRLLANLHRQGDDAKYFDYMGQALRAQREYQKQQASSSPSELSGN